MSSPLCRRIPVHVFGKIVLAAGVATLLVAVVYWLGSVRRNPGPIVRLGGTVRTESAPYTRLNTTIDRLLPGFSPRRDGFQRDVIVSVDLNQTDADNATLAYLRAMDHLKNLELAQTAVTDAGMVHLAALPRLKTLVLAQTGVGDHGLKQLASSPHLLVLNLIDTDISDAGLDSLKGLNLQVLHLGKNSRVTDEGIHQLATAMPGLTIHVLEFDAEDRIVRSRDFATAGCEGPDDVIVFLGWYDATDSDLAGRTAYPDLTALSLAGSRVTDEGLEQIHQCRHLSWIDLSQTQVTAEGASALKQSRPELNVIIE